MRESQDAPLEATKRNLYLIFRNQMQTQQQEDDTPNFNTHPGQVLNINLAEPEPKEKHWEKKN